MKREINPQELMTLLQQAEDDTMLLDVRKADDFADDPVLLPGAKHYSPEEIAEWSAILPKDRELIVYCVHGHQVSNGALDYLLDAGFKARLLAGGIEAWKQVSGKTVSV